MQTNSHSLKSTCILVVQWSVPPPTPIGKTVSRKSEEFWTFDPSRCNYVTVSPSDSTVGLPKD